MRISEWIIACTDAQTILTSFLHLHAHTPSTYKIFDVKLLNINICAIRYFIVLCIGFSAHIIPFICTVFESVTFQQTYWVAFLWLYVMSENKMPAIGGKLNLKMN